MRFLLGLVLFGGISALACEVGTSFDVSVGTVDYTSNDGFSTCTLTPGAEKITAQVVHYFKGASLSDTHWFPTTEMAHLEDAEIKRWIAQKQIAAPVVDWSIALPALTSLADYWKKTLPVPSLTDSTGGHPMPVKVIAWNGKSDPGKRFWGTLLEFDGKQALVRDDAEAQKMVVWALERCGHLYRSHR